MNKTVPHILRNMVEEDKGFIFETWLKTFWKNPPMNGCPPDFYLPHQREVIKKLLDTAEVQVACDPQDPDYILGYICYELVAGVLFVHWMHIKDTYRRMDLMNNILETLYPNVKKSAIICTHNSAVFRAMKDKYLLSYNPYYVMDRLLGKL